MHDPVREPARPPHRSAAASADPVDWVVGQLEESWRRESVDPGPGESRHRAFIALTGIVIIALLALESVSAVSLDSLWRLHFFVGFVLLPVLVAKLAPAALRASRYYADAVLRLVRRRGDAPMITPPVALARITAPPLVVAFAVLLGSGLVMWRAGDRYSVWSTVHNGSAVIAAGLLAVHLACHLRATMVTAAAEARPRRPRVRARHLLLAGSIAAGVVLGALTVPGATFQVRHRPDRVEGAAPASRHVAAAVPATRGLTAPRP